MLLATEINLDVLGFKYWFTGISDGDSCFSLNKIKDTDRYQARFMMTKRGDDQGILETVQKTLKIGNVYRTTQTINGKPTATFSVGKRKELLEIISHFEKYPLQTRKKHEFILWREAVLELGKPPKARNTKELYEIWAKIKALKKGWF